MPFVAGGNVASRRAALQGQSGWSLWYEKLPAIIEEVIDTLLSFERDLSRLQSAYVLGQLWLHPFTSEADVSMHNFQAQMGPTATNSTTKGWLVAILELGAWLGVLLTGPLTDRLSRKYTIVLAVVIFCIGVVVQTAAFHPSSIYGGKMISQISMHDTLP
ncbi:hypothetical protein Clacol_008718 [Clathrus columnatus]|uniref:Major facilitator superfamily (MFS) profile domain-containing protein n=1 Tax=Clathrus columnatus TaxID=1419009 RepID=A0AAV5AP46_9AGAM|nr:hypothetical protein Clacol_008718 [Clathrus columnatus]